MFEVFGQAIIRYLLVHELRLLQVKKHLKVHRSIENNLILSLNYGSISPCSEPFTSPQINGNQGFTFRLNYWRYALMSNVSH